jgi:uncharacterized protein (DUF1810 family)/N-formylglutamate amidohydrolase
MESFNLDRFLEAQQDAYEPALAEIRAGRKRSHWMWFIFPQFDGLGSSSTSKHFAIKSSDEAQAYLNHPILGPRLLECAKAALAVEGKSASQIFGWPDDMKLKSSATLFALVSAANSIFHQVLAKYFAGQQDEKTLELVGHRDVYSWTAGEGPIVATAIHAGHDIRPELLQHMALSEAERLREEDPFTNLWVDVGSTRVVGLRSRFEVDLNRPRDQAVYQRPEDAWGLKVWKQPLPPDVIERSWSLHDAFYERAKREFEILRQRRRRFVVLDLHSYNHRRGGADQPADDPQQNPEINIGTGSMDRRRWGGLVDRFIKDLHGYDFSGRSLDVRENVRFKGGYFSQWVHTNFPDSGCALAIEVKKFFMNEWTGQPDRKLIAAIGEALQSTVAGILRELSGAAP